MNYTMAFQCCFVDSRLTIVINMATTTTTVTGQIKSFEFIRTLFQALGMCSASQPNKNHSINTKALLILLYFVLFLTASIAFFLFKAESIGTLAYSYLISLSILLCVGLIVVNALKILKSLRLIEKFDEFIQKSEFFSSFY